MTSLHPILVLYFPCHFSPFLNFFLIFSFFFFSSLLLFLSILLVPFTRNWKENLLWNNCQILRLGKQTIILSFSLISHQHLLTKVLYHKDLFIFVWSSSKFLPIFLICWDFYYHPRLSAVESSVLFGEYLREIIILQVPAPNLRTMKRWYLDDL